MNRKSLSVNGIIRTNGIKTVGSAGRAEEAGKWRRLHVNQLTPTELDALIVLVIDCILVMRRGRLVADLVTSETSQEAVMQLAAVDEARA